MLILYKRIKGYPCGRLLVVRIVVVGSESLFFLVKKEPKKHLQGKSIIVCVKVSYTGPLKGPGAYFACVSVSLWQRLRGTHPQTFGPKGTSDPPYEGDCVSNDLA